MKNPFLIFLFIIVSHSVFCQTEVVKDSLPSLKIERSIANESLDNYLQIDNSVNSLANQAFPDYTPYVKENKSLFELDIPPVTLYKGPLIDDNPIISRFPFVNDYSFFNVTPLSRRAWISTMARQNTYPTLGAVRSVYAQFNYKVTDWLIFSGGTYGAKYNLYGGHYNDFGTTGAMKFILHDRIRINGYGQYSVNAKSNGVGNTMGMFPQTYYGGTLEFKVTEKFGVEGGVIRELNPLNGKWVNRPYIAPVFYGK